MILRKLLTDVVTKLPRFEVSFGPGLCGKGTTIEIAQRCCIDMNAVSISPSALMAQHIKQGTDLAPAFIEAKEVVRQGGLVDDTPINTALARDIERCVLSGLYIMFLDGYPRRESQVKELDELGIPFNFYNFTFPVEEGLRRLKNVQEGNDPDRLDRDDDKSEDVYRGRYLQFELESLPAYHYVLRKYPDRVVEIPWQNSPADRARIVISHMTLREQDRKLALSRVDAVVKQIAQEKRQKMLRQVRILKKNAA